MAGQTPRFALNYFGGDVDGTFDDDNDKFTFLDRLTLDRILAALEKHDHHVVDAIPLPTIEPLATLHSTGGELSAGTSYFYVVSFVDTDGLETIIGPETSVDTPDILPTPDPPQAITDITPPGTLAPGLYYYALTAKRAGEETALGNPVAVTVLAGEQTVILTLPALGDATSYQVWRMKDTDPGWTRIALATTTTVTDIGTVPAGVYGDPANAVPTATTGLDTYSITVALQGDDITDVQNTSGWRLYRSTESGIYTANSLVHDVIEREDELDPGSDLLTEWLDDGDALGVGTPKQTIANTLSIAPLTLQYAAVLPATTGYPPYFPLLGPADILYYNKAGTWTQVSPATPGITYAGAWDIATTYPADTLTLHQQGLWLNPAISLAQEPGTGHWNLLARSVTTGGTIGQILTKTGSADEAYTWADPVASGGGSGSDYQMLTGDLTITSTGIDVPIFDPVLIPQSSVYSFEVYLRYRGDDTGIAVAFGPNTSGGFISTGDGELWYDQHAAVKIGDLAGGRISTDTSDGGSAITLASTGTPYILKARFVVVNTGIGDSTITFTANLAAAATLTIDLGAVLSATLMNIASSSTSGTTV